MNAVRKWRTRPSRLQPVRAIKAATGNERARNALHWRKIGSERLVVTGAGGVFMAQPHPPAQPDRLLDAGASVERTPRSKYPAARTTKQRASVC
jgi:hypothetical protein